jgi:hypothetical protein
MAKFISFIEVGYKGKYNHSLIENRLDFGSK